MSTAPARPAATCATHRSVLDAAARSEQALARFLEDRADHRRAREILTALATHCRTVADVFTVDPTLADEPYGTGRFRVVDLFTELARQTRPLLTIACAGGAHGRRSAQDCWDEAEALFERAGFFAALIPTVVPRPDHATEAGARAISHDRVAARADELARAAGSVRAALVDALRVPHPDPAVLALAVLADELSTHATTLAAHHEQRTLALDTACGLPGHRPEPGEQTAS